MPPRPCPLRRRPRGAASVWPGRCDEDDEARAILTELGAAPLLARLDPTARFYGVVSEDLQRHASDRRV
jgi:hypothetical protein